MLRWNCWISYLLFIPALPERKSWILPEKQLLSFSCSMPTKQVKLPAPSYLFPNPKKQPKQSPPSTLLRNAAAFISDGQKTGWACAAQPACLWEKPCPRVSHAKDEPDCQGCYQRWVQEASSVMEWGASGSAVWLTSICVMVLLIQGHILEFKSTHTSVRLMTFS